MRGAAVGFGGTGREEGLVEVLLDGRGGTAAAGAKVDEDVGVDGGF